MTKNFSLRELFVFMAALAAAVTILRQHKTIERQREMLYPHGYTYYSIEDKTIQVCLYLSDEEFAELYPDEWKYQVEPSRDKD
jgi:hypothetical protein